MDSIQWYVVEHNDATKYNFAVETTTDKFGIGGVSFLNKGENYVMPTITFNGTGTGAKAVVSRLDENNGIQEIELLMEVQDTVMQQLLQLMVMVTEAMLF